MFAEMSRNTSAQKLTDSADSLCSLNSAETLIMLLVEWPILCKTVAHANALRALSHFKACNNEAGVHGFSNVHASETLMIIWAFLVSSPIAIGSTGPLHTLITSSPHMLPGAPVPMLRLGKPLSSRKALASKPFKSSQVERKVSGG